MIPGGVVAVGLLALAVPEVSAAPARAEGPRAATAPARRSVALLGITGGTGMDAKMLASLEEVILSALSSGSFARVVGRSDIASVLGWEEKKQKLGCDESSACIAEVAGALGVVVIAATDVARVGAYVLLSFKLIDARAGTALVRVSRRVNSESELVEALEPAVAEALARAFPAAPSAESTPAQPEPWARSASPQPAHPERRASSASPESRETRRSRIAAWSLLGAAVVAAAAGGYFVADAWSNTGAMASAVDDAVLARAKTDAKSAAMEANISFAAAGTALVAGVAVWWLGGRSAERPGPAMDSKDAAP